MSIHITLQQLNIAMENGSFDSFVDLYMMIWFDYEKLWLSIAVLN